MLVSLFAGTTFSIPMPWSETLLEDINSLRASGLSEVRARSHLSSATSQTPQPHNIVKKQEAKKADILSLSQADIALRFPRALFYPNPTSPSRITLYSPPDLRSYASNGNHHHSNHNQPKGPSFIARLAQKLGLTLGGDGGCDDQDDDDGVGDGGFFWELVDEEDRRHGKARFTEGVGKRGGQMGRKED